MNFFTAAEARRNVDLIKDERRIKQLKRFETLDQEKCNKILERIFDGIRKEMKDGRSLLNLKIHGLCGSPTGDKEPGSSANHRFITNTLEQLGYWVHWTNNVDISVRW